MKLRSYQEKFVKKSLTSLAIHAGVLGIGATGCGKTVMLSSVAKEYRRVLILQHQTELLEQNSKTFGWVCPGVEFGIVDQEHNDFTRNITFAMRQTLINKLDLLKAVDLIIIDECHHTTCSEYATIIEHLKKLNPGTKLFGVTATPERADQADMSKYYDVISDKININDLIKLGYLVAPKAYVVKIGGSPGTTAELDKILSSDISSKRVIEEWKAKAKGRRTVVFCQTVHHAKIVAAEFDNAGIPATSVDGKMPARERKKRLKAFDKGDYQVITNANILTEGYDCQPISCVILLRASSSKSSLIQMVGRGLRKLDPVRYPTVVKHDCIVLDFGVSLHRHGDLNAGDRLSFNQEEYEAEINPALQCPACGGAIEPRMKQCPSCLHIIERDADGIPKPPPQPLTDFKLSEIELLNASRFHYEKLSKRMMISNGWSAWALVITKNGVHYTVAGKTKCPAKIIGCSPNKFQAIASADDHLSEFGDSNLSGKQKKWINELATQKQIDLLPEEIRNQKMTKHQASCLLIIHNENRFNRIKKMCKEHYDKTGYKYAEMLNN